MSILKLDAIQLGRNSDPTRNFNWNSPIAGVYALSAGIVGSNTADILKVSASEITLLAPKAFTSPAANDSSKLLATTEWIANRFNSEEVMSADALITVKQPFNGAVARTQHAKNKEIVSTADIPYGDPYKNVLASTAGIQILSAGDHIMNGSTRHFPKDVQITENLLPVGVGTEDRGNENTYHIDRSALRVGSSDMTMKNDERNFWRGLPNGANSDAWGDKSLIGLFSTAFNRNGVSYAPYSNTFGHDCITYGTASIAGGAGTCTGDPDHPTSSAFEGYCSIAWGKNVLASGQKSAAFCEETFADGRASFAAGYSSKAGKWNDDGIGVTAIGREAQAHGNDTVSIGAYLNAYNGAQLFGSGINSGNPMVALTRTVGIGSNVVMPTIECSPGNGTINSFGSVLIRGGLQRYSEEVVATGLANTVQFLSNSGSGGYGTYSIRPLKAGAIVSGFAVDAGQDGVNGVVSFIPESDTDKRLGAANKRFDTIFLYNAPIVTSDIREKQQIRELSEKEKLVASELKGLIKAYKWNKDVNTLKDDAKITFGVMAQEVISAFEKHGLDANNYSIVQHHKWDSRAAIYDSNDVLVSDEVIGGDRFSVQYEPLLAFIISAL